PNRPPQRDERLCQCVRSNDVLAGVADEDVSHSRLPHVAPRAVQPFHHAAGSRMRQCRRSREVISPFPPGTRRWPVHSNPSHLRVAIVGAGFGGLGAAIRLRQQGIDEFLVFERADDLGGTWRDNSYPGCACDVPSHLYSFSFAPNPRWSRSFSGQPEIWGYLRDCASRFGVLPHPRLGHEVRQAGWDDRRQRWQIETAGGTWTADVLVAAAGPLSEPAIPAPPGLEGCEGAVFHSARWDHDHDLTGRQVAVVGTGAS